MNLIKKIRKVLIGSAGTGTAFAAISSLRRVWSQSVHVVTMDINPPHLVTASLIADNFEQVPISSAPEFQEALLQIIQRYDIDTYLPLLPEEIELAARLRADGVIPSKVVVMAPSVAVSSACADKWVLSQLLSKNGVPTPKTALASDPFEAGGYFLKPKLATGSRGARKVNAEELTNAISGCEDKWIVQEICTAPEVTIDVFRSPSSGGNHVLCRERVEIKLGVSTKSRLFVDVELERLAKAIADMLDLTGSFCFQVMRNKSGWVVTDVNPRPGAATAMCAVTGNDFFAAAFACYWGEDVRRFFRPLVADQYVTRQYAEFLMGPLA